MARQEDLKVNQEETESEYGDVNDADDDEEHLEKIDRYSFRLFPVIFVLNNLPYWWYYVSVSPCENVN